MFIQAAQARIEFARPMSCPNFAFVGLLDKSREKARGIHAKKRQSA
jgi:hypothetical protein